jgi:hypothetical protein
MRTLCEVVCASRLRFTTDNVGSVESNLKLSDQRAQAVLKALVAQHGIAAARKGGRRTGESTCARRLSRKLALANVVLKLVGKQGGRPTNAADRVGWLGGLDEVRTALLACV